MTKESLMSSKDYDEFTKPNPTLKEFMEKLLDEHGYVRMVGYKYDEMSSHKIPTAVSVNCDNDPDASYKLVGIQLDQLMGCGCESGISLVVLREPDNVLCGEPDELRCALAHTTYRVTKADHEEPFSCYTCGETGKTHRLHIECAIEHRKLNPDHKIMDWLEYARYSNDKARAARKNL
jgi:hypothetical protein